MNQDADPPVPPPFSRPLRVDAIADGVSLRIEATKSEMAAIATLLDLVGLERLSFSYRLRHRAGRRLQLAGRLEADVTQTCVVSLEPVGAHLDVPVEAEFWPEETIGDLDQSAGDPASPGVFDWPEPIKDGMIDLGPVIYESLATSLDPYPKREGVSFEWSHTAEEEAAPSGSGHFAALARLKRD